MAEVEAPTCDRPLRMRNVRGRAAAPNLSYSDKIGDQDNTSNAATCRPRGRCTRSSIVLIAVALLIAFGVRGRAAAQSVCSTSGSIVVLSGAGASCTIPTATLTGNTSISGINPTVAATSGAQITTNTNNVVIKPNNGGTTGGLAETMGTITFGPGSIIEGNFATAASAQTGGQIIFLPGSVINPPFGGGEIGLLANGTGSQITATGLTVNMNGNGGDVGAKASGGGSIFLNHGTTISFPPGGGGDIGLLATGPGSQIVANGISDTMVGVGGRDVGVNADMGGKVTLTNSIVSDVGNGGGEVGLKATNSSSIVTSGGSVSVVNGVGGLLQNSGSITMDGTNVTASGNGGNGFQFNSGAGTNTLQYSNGAIAAASIDPQAATSPHEFSLAVSTNDTSLTQRRCRHCAQPMTLIRRTQRFGGLTDLCTFECEACDFTLVEECRSKAGKGMPRTGDAGSG